MLLIKDRNGVVSPKCEALVAIGERPEGPQKRLSRNEVAECLSELLVAVDIAKVRGNIKVYQLVAELLHLIYVQLKTLCLRR